ncbi:ATP-grasp domain-containing protein [Aeromonas taiwanensis]|uniref:ATP-grasp domain-containing protein n=1 Tax=Aeromonas taiwanensis TaxID=633417 RepID=A0A5F0KD38_9GAMM|nr:ATP-grasp domain-containing protein [Aeromonas taiwanensis]TFF78411.1 ATP-grasp domain-containing protein [Aeromonas taiwanensis]TFF79017.1 ATP-grasp domain-containing protein [Aeromonas taiwanensis]TFF82471.1 ATP-grasp domain-containing protein [Aeromonas taiwanensis]
MKNNVLILSAGRRVELVQEFQKDLKAIFPHSYVYCCDMAPEFSSACQIADGYFKVPRVTSDDYLSVLTKICLENSVGLVIPTIDTELLLLSNARDSFLANGIQIVISSIEFVSSCRDKRMTANFFTEYDIDQPEIYNKNKLKYPCFCKPYDGSCSIGAFVVRSESDLTEDIIEDDKNMFMEFIPKTFSEYTVDGYYTDNGNLTCLVPRKRLEIRGGEVSKGITKKDFVYDYLLSKLMYVPGARGCITFQFFVNEKSKEIKGLEINPRFGGGYPLAYESGAHYPQWLINEYLLGSTPAFFDGWESGLMMLRYDAKVLIREATD